MVYRVGLLVEVVLQKFPIVSQKALFLPCFYQGRFPQHLLLDIDWSVNALDPPTSWVISPQMPTMDVSQTEDG
jgi:hypothetical protein